MGDMTKDIFLALDWTKILQSGVALNVAQNSFQRIPRHRF